MNDDLISTSEAAHKLGITAIRIRAMIRAGNLPAQKIGRDYVVKVSDLELVKNRKPGRPSKEDSKK